MSTQFVFQMYFQVMIINFINFITAAYNFRILNTKLPEISPQLSFTLNYELESHLSY